MPHRPISKVRVLSLATGAALLGATLPAWAHAGHGPHSLQDALSHLLAIAALGGGLAALLVLGERLVQGLRRRP